MAKVSLSSRNKLKIIDQLAVTSSCTIDDFKSMSDPNSSGWFCHHCQKTVHDFSKLSKKEILTLVENSGDSFCASISRRVDGSIITKETPSNSLFYSGVMLVGTALLASSVSAETSIEVGEISENSPSVKQLPGEVTTPNPSKSPSTDCDVPTESETKQIQNNSNLPEQPSSQQAPVQQSTEIGKVKVQEIGRTRGKVMIKK